MAVNAIVRQVVRRKPRTLHAFVLAVASGLALVIASVSSAPVSAHRSNTHIPLHAASGKPSHTVPVKSPGMYCGMPNAPKVTLIHSATRAEAKADLARFNGKAVAATIGDNFILGSPYDVVQGDTCYGGYNSTSSVWSGIIADEYGSSSTAKAYGAQGEYRLRSVSGQDLATWTSIGGDSSGSDIVQDGVDQTKTSQNLWYEFWPNNPVYLTGHTAASNDVIFTSVYETSSTSHSYQVVIEDLSSSPHYIFDNYYTFNESSATHNSAEWITEFPSGSGTIPYFQDVTFTNGYWANALGDSENITAAYNVGDIELYAPSYANCIRVTNLSSNGLQTNWVAYASCP